MDAKKVVDRILKAPVKSRIYPDNEARPILRELSSRAVKKSTHRSIGVYADRLNDQQAFFLIRAVILTDPVALLKIEAEGQAIKRVANLMCQVKLDWYDLQRGKWTPQELTSLSDEEVRIACLRLLAVDAACPKTPREWLENHIRFAKHFKNSHPKYAWWIYDCYVQDNPDLMHNPVFKEFAEN